MFLPSALRASPVTAKAEAKLILTTDGQTLQAQELVNATPGKPGMATRTWPSDILNAVGTVNTRIWLCIFDWRRVHGNFDSPCP